VDGRKATLTIAPARKSFDVRLTVSWKGISGAAYTTVFGFRFLKEGGLDRLNVINDTSAVFKIKAENLAETEASLRTHLDTLR
jgi:hypothetical protein